MRELNPIEQTIVAGGGVASTLGVVVGVCAAGITYIPAMVMAGFATASGDPITIQLTEILFIGFEATVFAVGYGIGWGIGNCADNTFA